MTITLLSTITMMRSRMVMKSPKTGHYWIFYHEIIATKPRVMHFRGNLHGVIGIRISLSFVKPLHFFHFMNYWINLPHSGFPVLISIRLAVKQFLIPLATI